jgi:phospholipid transport system substrate-binding protein
MRKFSGFLGAICLCFSTMTWAVESAVPMLEGAANQIITTLKANQSKLKDNHQIVEHAVRQYLLPHVDVVGMSRSVLGRNAWNKATSAERQEFTSAFTDLVIRTYAAPLSEYSGETITFGPQQSADGKFARVNSFIKRNNGQTIPLSYALITKGEEWKVYDLSVEGVSLLQSFRNQFSQVLQNSDMKTLISQMKQRKMAA